MWNLLESTAIRRSKAPHSIGLNRRILTNFFVAVLLFLAATPARNLYGQTWNSHLEGIVLDPSGAAVPAASLELRNPATGQVRQTQTDANGFYSFPLLPVGNYELEIAKAGFVSKVVRGLALRVGETARVDIHLEIAHERTEIQVDTRPPLVEAASPAIGDEIENRRVSLLPLNGRQFSQLALLAAGAVPPYPNSSTQQFNTPALGLGFSVNGQRSERNNFSLDGVTLMEPFAYSLTVNPSIDAIREFRVVEDSYGADQGITSGAQVNIASRSGANRFSGTAYEFLRNSALDAKNFFDDPTRPIPPYRQNQFGASLGGPIRRDRTFFLHQLRRLAHSPERHEYHLAASRPPSAREISAASIPRRASLFRQLLTPLRASLSRATQSRASRIDPLSRAILARIPLPNDPNAPPGENNDINVGLHRVTTDQFMARIDHELTPKHQLFGRFLLFNQTATVSFRPGLVRAESLRPAGIRHQQGRHGKEPRTGAYFRFSAYTHQRFPVRLRLLFRDQGSSEHSQRIPGVAGNHPRSGGHQRRHPRH